MSGDIHYTLKVSESTETLTPMKYKWDIQPKVAVNMQKTFDIFHNDSQRTNPQ